jgi:hypothetical protein
LTEEELWPLKLFNEKTEKLLTSRFVRYLIEQKPISFKYDFQKGKGIEITKEMQDEDNIDAIVLTVRFFIQDNEDCSFHNVAEAYEKLPLSQELKNEYRNARMKLNDFLDSVGQIAITIKEEEITNRRILDIFVYGDLAHKNNPIKRKVFEEWMKDEVAMEFLKYRFCLILMTIWEVIQDVRAINIRAIEELSR